MIIYMIIYWLIHKSAFLASKVMKHFTEIWDLDSIPYFYDWSKDIFKVHVPIDSSTHCPTF